MKVLVPYASLVIPVTAAAPLAAPRNHRSGFRCDRRAKEKVPESAGRLFKKQKFCSSTRETRGVCPMFSTAKLLARCFEMEGSKAEEATSALIRRLDPR